MYAFVAIICLTVCVWVCFAVAMWNDLANDLDKLDKMLEDLNNPEYPAPGQFIVEFIIFTVSVCSIESARQDVTV